MTPFKRPLSILIDQLFVVSSRDVWVLYSELRSDLAPFLKIGVTFCYFPFAWENAIVYGAY